MDFNLTQDQAELTAVTRRYAERYLAYQDVRTGAALLPDAHAIAGTVGELGWIALAVPEELGGAGAGVLELSLVLEELGRAGALTPLLSTAVFGAIPLARTSNAGLREAYLDGVLAGEMIATMGLLDDAGSDEWDAAPVHGKRHDTGWSLHGSLPLVPWGTDADLLTAACELEDFGPAVVLVPTSSSGFAATPNHTLDSEPKSRVTLDGLEIGRDAVLAQGDEALALLDELRDTATLALTAWAVGACEAALHLAVEYAKTRVQFGRPIATYQSISNRCADMRLGIDPTRLMVREAAWNLDQGAPSAELVATAKAFGNDAFGVVIVNSHQVHGAMGYSTEYPLHHYTRILKSCQLTLGSSGLQLDRIAAALGL